jgi:hypothetical protein
MRAIVALLAMLSLAPVAAAADSTPGPSPDPAAGAAAAKPHGTVTGRLTAVVTPGSGGPSITVTPTPAQGKKAAAGTAGDADAKPLQLRADQAKVTIDGHAATFDDLHLDDLAVVDYDGDAAVSIAITHAKPRKAGKNKR